MRGILFALCAALTVAVATQAGATTTTIGSLSYNDAGGNQVITDSLNNLEWLRWDVLANDTYQQTLDAIAAGGAYEGWHIADGTKAQQFVDALVGTPNGCDTTSGITSCVTYNSISNFSALVGDNYTANTGTGTNNDVAWFMSDVNAGAPVGFVQTLDFFANNPQSSAVYKNNSWNTVAFSDNYATGGSYSSNPIGWLLYRDVTTVPVPASLPLLLAGLAGLGLTARRRRR